MADIQADTPERQKKRSKRGLLLNVAICSIALLAGLTVAGVMLRETTPANACSLNYIRLGDVGEYLDVDGIQVTAIPLEPLPTEEQLRNMIEEVETANCMDGTMNIAFLESQIARHKG